MKSVGVKKGAWDGEEDLLLRRCIETHGEGNWHLVSKRSGLNRCRKSCRLRWLNYLQPNLNREEFKEDEVDLIIRLHKLLGNRWSLIAGRLPGRTANDIKNYWTVHLSKRIAPKPKDTLHQQRYGSHEIIRPRPTFLKSKESIPQTKQHQETEKQRDVISCRFPQPGRMANYCDAHSSKKPDPKPNDPLCQLSQGRHEVFRPQPTYFKSKIIYRPPIESSIPRSQQLLKKQKQHHVLTHTPSSDDIHNKMVSSKDRITTETCKTTNPERVIFDDCDFDWDDLLRTRDWLMN